jgi:tRNA threonylcarbamoyladenosine biosynthesis protein TsaE
MDKIVTKNFKETQKFGEKLAKDVLSLPQEKTAVVIVLSGNLGAGKTTFLQGFAKGIGVKEKILSPTFVIMKRFKIKKGNFYHIDCYRIDSPRDILELDFTKIILEPKNIVAIEWPEKIKKLLPKKSVMIKFKFIDKNTREIELKCAIIKNGK